MKVCISSYVGMAILWIFIWNDFLEAQAQRKRNRASHVMRGFGPYRKEMFPNSLQLFDSCKTSFDCLFFITNSECDWGSRTCVCKSHHIPFNNTMCLPASLLGYGCIVDAQCTKKVKNSRCVNGLCECEDNHIQYRLDKCLPPAIINDYCVSHEQCQRADRYTFCNWIIPKIYGKCACPKEYKHTSEGRCLPHLGNYCLNHQDCESATTNSYCLRQNGNATCECRVGFEMSKDQMRCEPVITFVENFSVRDVSSLGKTCTTDGQCKARDPYSLCRNGVCDCEVPDTQCNLNKTGCHHDTFQCRTGYCISWYFVCDKQMNCPDNSDEDECVRFNCPKQAFQCDDGTCLSKASVCNGQWECPDGSDEARCYTGIACDRNAMRCKNGQCLPQYSFCNAVVDCADGSDEDEEMCEKGLDCPRFGIKCDNGRCRSSAILCSGPDGCGDNTDERNCEACYCKKP